MAKDCRNKYKKAHYQANIDRYRKIKKAEELRNRPARTIKNRPQRLQKYYEDFVNTLFVSAKERARLNNLEFDIDKDFIMLLYENQSKKCSVTGIEFEHQKIENLRRRPFAPSLDRINSDAGYTKDNVRLVCAIVNIALSDFGDLAFDKMCKAYANKELK